ncbi:MAG: hypothetical protein IPL99_12280 [Candidatus Competibacteraceae bacterium]|nr:hypothetical protein [Candidatus Competibacteraceae bacterium]
MALTAKVDAVLNPSDSLLWEYGFIPLSEYVGGDWTQGMTFDGTAMEPDTYWDLEAGTWEITATNGVFNTSGANIVLQGEDGFNLFTFDSAQQDQILTVAVPYGQKKKIIGYQSQQWFAATLQASRRFRFNEYGEQPTVTTTGDQLHIGWQWGTPCKGTFTAKARIYNAVGTIQDTSNDLTLNITGSMSGGC